MIGLPAVNGFCQSMTVDEMESFSFYYENDIVAGTDKNYSNAIKFSWISADLDEYDALGNLTPDKSTFWGKFLSHEGFQRNIGISFGQNMYTPEDIETRELIKDDRPYAGLTYLGLALHRKNEIILDTIELNIGIVGPDSLAEDGQKLVHEITGSSIPNGWGNQLDNEFGFALTLQRSRRFVSRHIGTGWGWDLIPHAGLTAGTFAVYANTGAELRFGYYIPSDFGNALARPGENVSVPVGRSGNRTSRWHRFSITAFLSIEGRAVAHNIFLDGNTFTDSHSVDKKPFVGDFSSGLSINYKAFKLTYAHVYRSPEFEGQDKGHSFGSLSLSYIY
jgi:hypothetical protein